MNILMTNGHILTKPLEIQNIEQTVKNGFATFKNKVSFQVVEVVHGSAKYQSGVKVLLKGDSFAAHWAKAKFTVDGQELMMVPETEVVGVVQ